MPEQITQITMCVHCGERHTIQGLDVPVALRCVGDGLYSLVGVVYVHSIMHGEAVLDSTDVVELDLV